MSYVESLIKYIPIVAAVVALGGSAAVAQFQINDSAKAITELEEALDLTEEEIEDIQRLLIRRQGEISLDLERMKNKVDQQSDKLDEVIQLLKQ